MEYIIESITSPQSAENEGVYTRRARLKQLTVAGQSFLLNLYSRFEGSNNVSGALLNNEGQAVENTNLVVLREENNMPLPKWQPGDVVTDEIEE